MRPHNDRPTWVIVCDIIFIVVAQQFQESIQQSSKESGSSERSGTDVSYDTGEKVKRPKIPTTDVNKEQQSSTFPTGEMQRSADASDQASTDSHPSGLDEDEG